MADNSDKCPVCGFSTAMISLDRSCICRKPLKDWINTVREKSIEDNISFDDFKTDGRFLKSRDVWHTRVIKTASIDYAKPDELVGFTIPNGTLDMIRDHINSGVAPIVMKKRVVYQDNQHRNPICDKCGYPKFAVETETGKTSACFCDGRSFRMTVTYDKFGGFSYYMEEIEEQPVNPPQTLMGFPVVTSESVPEGEIIMGEESIINRRYREYIHEQRKNMPKIGEHILGVFITPEMLSVLLREETNHRCMQGVPADAKFLGAHPDARRNGIIVMFEHPSFEFVPAGQEAPMIYGRWETIE